MVAVRQMIEILTEYLIIGQLNNKLATDGQRHMSAADQASVGVDAKETVHKG